MDFDDWGYPEGECFCPEVFEEEKHEIIIYDHNGNALVKPRIKLGFDLTE